MAAHRLLGAMGVAALAGTLAGCKPPAFAGSEEAALHRPPASLQDGQRAFWNDLPHQSFGMFELGAGAYRYGPDLCKIALETVIDNGRQQAGNDGFLYCVAPGGGWHVRPGVVCRPAAGPGGAACRDPAGDYVTLPPARLGPE